MRKRAVTTILKANGATIERNGATTETDGDNNDNSRAYKRNRKTVPDVTALRFTGMT